MIQSLSDSFDLAALHQELEIPASYALQRKLNVQPEAAAVELVPITQGAVREIHLQRAAAEAWFRLSARAASDGIELQPLSGFRSIARQAEIIRRKRHRGASISEILRVNAAPGYSEHHTGRAIAIGTSGFLPLDQTFEQSAAFGWLSHHAPQFGFTLSYPAINSRGIGFEPWHWCWNGTPP